MSDETRFLIFAIEYYRRAKGLSGREVAALFEANGLSGIITDGYFFYHMESPDHLVEDLDYYLANGRLPG